MSTAIVDRSRRTAAPAITRTGSVGAVQAPGVLVGREAERRALDDLVDALADGTPGVALLIGEAGIGKSTLLRAATARSATGGITVIAGRGDPLTEDRPALALLDALGIDLGTAAGRSVIEAGLTDPATLLVHRILDALDRRGLDGPVLLALDDVQWLDRASLTLIQHLATRPATTPVGVVAAGRTPLPGTPLHHLVADLGPHLHEVGPLAGPEARAVAEHRLGHAVGPRLSATVEEANGNPMLVEAIVDSLVAGGSIAVEDDRAELRDGGQQAAPTQVIADRLAALSPAVLEVVQVAAVTGRRVRVDLLAEVLGRSPLAVVRLIGDSIAGGVLDDRDGEVVFRHDLYREAALATLPTTGREALHVAVAAALTDVGAPVLEVAEHYALGAQPGNQAAADHLAAAASEVVGAAPAVALRLCEVATTLAVGTADDIGLQVTQVRALAGCGRIAEAELLGRSVLHREPDALLQAQVHRELALTAFIDGRPADATSHMRRAVELVAEGDQRATATAELAWASMLALDASASRHDAEAAIDLGQRVGDADAIVTARALLCWLDLWQVDLAIADRGADTLREVLATAPPGPWQAVQPWLAIAAVRLDLDRFDEAIESAESGRRLALDSGSGWAAPAYETLIADALLRCGRVAEAAERARGAVEGTALIDGFGVEVWARSVLAQTFLAHGRLDDAASEIAAADVALSDGRAQFGVDQMVIARARIQEAEGEVEAAQVTYRAGWELIGAVGIHHVLPAIGPGLVRTSRMAGAVPADDGTDDLVNRVVEHLDATAERTHLASHRLLAAHARAWADPMTADLEELAGLAARVRRPTLCHQVWVDLATLERSAGRTGAAGRAERRAAALAESWGVQGEPTGRGTTTRRARPRFGIAALTPAERRVADLVAAGLTNAQIAAELVVSRRTIDSHVLAAYRKLEVSSRVALTRVIIEEGAP